MSIRAEVVTPALLRAWPLPEPDGGKRSRGQVAVIGGSSTTPGALMLAGVAALRVGAGVLALAAPDCVAVELAIAVPESSVQGYDEGDCWSDDRLAGVCKEADAVVVGPGLDGPDAAKRLVNGLDSQLSESTPVCLDAFALGALPKSSFESSRARRGVVLTPNAEEAQRLLGRAPEDQDEVVASTIARRWHAVVTYGGAIAEPHGNVWRNGAGQSGLGTGGSGDVLAGAVGGLLARGADLSQAAVWATYLHATAGDRLASRIGPIGFLARELPDQFPILLAELRA